MEREYSHIPVMADECVAYLNVRRGGVYVDGTVGGAGHALLILEKAYGEGAVLIGIDRDKKAAETAARRLKAANAGYGGLARCEVARANHADIDNICRQFGVTEADGVLLDLGVSSNQLDDAERGFSFMKDAPLDMRMDQDSPLTAADVVNGYSERELSEIIYTYGDERWAARIARFIAERRSSGPIRTTFELADAVSAAVPAAARRGRLHPATRTFLAIRLIVNSELDGLKAAIVKSAGLLRTGGRLCVISFHSGEDLIVKTAINELSASCICPKDLPVCACGRSAVLRRVTRRPAAPSDAEIGNNVRARSARLRVAEKLAPIIN